MDIEKIQNLIPIAEIPTAIRELDDAIDSDVVDLVIDRYETVHSLLELATEARAASTRPFYQQKLAIEKEFRPWVQALEGAIKVADEWLAEYSAKTDRTITVRSARLIGRYEVEAIVVDEAALPRKFLTVDEKALADHVRRFADAVDIPGVQFRRVLRLRKRPQKKISSEVEQ